MGVRASSLSTHQGCWHPFQCITYVWEEVCNTHAESCYCLTWKYIRGFLMYFTLSFPYGLQGCPLWFHYYLSYFLTTFSLAHYLTITLSILQFLVEEPSLLSAFLHAGPSDWTWLTGSLDDQHLLMLLVLLLFSSPQTFPEFWISWVVMSLFPSWFLQLIIFFVFIYF